MRRGVREQVSREECFVREGSTRAWRGDRRSHAGALYNPAMTALQLRKQIKKWVDALPPDRLASLAEFVAFLSRPKLVERVVKAERKLAAGKGVNWRSVRRDV
jgi:hypothetical protein